MNIRKAQLADAAGIAAHHIATWQSAYRGQLPDSYLDNLSVEKRTERWREILGGLTEERIILVAEVDGVIIGHASAGPSRDEDADSETGELYSLYVSPESMGGGVGSALMTRAIDFLQEQHYKKATLWTLTDNKKSRIFYEKRGWIPQEKTQSEIRGEVTLVSTRYLLPLDVHED